ncbi:MAG: hypothetical protein DIU80_024655 [Chloroflexota bacterium]
MSTRQLVITALVIVLAVWIFMSQLDTLSKAVALVALVIAEVLALRRR